MSVSRIWSVCVLILCCLVMPGALVAGEVASFPDGYTYERYQRDRESAEKGDAEAQFLMGYLHHRSLVKFVEPDSGKALGWYQKAALQGHAQSAQVLGLMFQKGDGTEADPRAAKQWFQYAADRGLAQSQYAVGLLYAEGVGVPRDEELALFWFKRADKQDFSPAAIGIGAMHAGGRGVPRDVEVAFDWFLRSAELGNGEGMLRVSGMYRSGTGVGKDTGIAIRWLEEALKLNTPASLLASNDLAWILSTCPDEQYRDARRALALADSLVKSGVTKPSTLDTLAAACASNGYFDRAVRVQEEALAKLEGTEETHLIPSFRERLALYRKGKVWLDAF